MPRKLTRLAAQQLAAVLAHVTKFVVLYAGYLLQDSLGVRFGIGLFVFGYLSGGRAVLLTMRTKPFALGRLEQLGLQANQMKRLGARVAQDYFAARLTHVTIVLMLIAL